MFTSSETPLVTVNVSWRIIYHNVPFQMRAGLTVVPAEVSVGTGESVEVSWSVVEDVSASDWIGLFLVGEK